MGIGDWSGEVMFVEDFTVPELQIISNVDNETKTISMSLTYPSCTQPFIVATEQPTFPPSIIPTDNTTATLTQAATENVTSEVTGNTTIVNNTSNIPATAIEALLTYLYPQSDDEVLEWQKGDQ